jgi:hypothetical protein
MALEAMRQNAPAATPHPAVALFAQQVDDNLKNLAGCLRNGNKPPGSTGLRAAQDALQRALETVSGEDERLRAMAWVECSDRITDAVNTIAHLLR